MRRTPTESECSSHLSYAIATAEPLGRAARFHTLLVQPHAELARSNRTNFRYRDTALGHQALDVARSHTQNVCDTVDIDEGCGQR